MPRRKVVEDEGPSKAWLDSYADAMTLLLAFFILLFAFSLVDEEKFTEFKFGVNQAFGRSAPTFEGGVGILDRGNGVASQVATPPVIPEEDEPDLTTLEEIDVVSDVNVEVLVQEIQNRVAELGAAEFVSLERGPRGLIVRMDTTVLFRSGAAQILPDGVTVLSSVAEVLREIDNLVVVEGHTDDVPTNGGSYATNWELSAARAASVLRFFSELQGIPAPRLSLAGYADTRPRVLNDSAENRAINRRVELVIVIDPADPVDVGDNQLTDVVADVDQFIPGRPIDQSEIIDPSTVPVTEEELD